jgi:hypothetical protein
MSNSIGITKMMPENAKPIPSFDGYFVTEGGDVYSTAWGKVRKLSQWINWNGYLTCKASVKILPLHRAVALTWVPNPNNDTDVNHIDGNKLNNNSTNLEWCSRRSNIHHALRSGLHPEQETPIVATHIDTGEVLRFISQASVKDAGFSKPNVNKCLRGIRPHHKRYTWRYDENPPP